MREYLVLPLLLHILVVLSVAPGDVVTAMVSSLYVYYVFLQCIKCLKVVGVAWYLPAIKEDTINRKAKA